MKNICNRCGKVWYLGSGELEDLENRFKIAQKGMEGQLRVELVTSLFDPMLAAQMGGGSMAGLRPVQRLREELMEKSRCPECQSKHVERVLVDADETISGKKATTFGREQQGVIKKKIVEKESSGSLADELKKLNELKEQGILDEEEFKTAKRKLLENQ